MIGWWLDFWLAFVAALAAHLITAYAVGSYLRHNRKRYPRA